MAIDRTNLVRYWLKHWGRSVADAPSRDAFPSDRRVAQCQVLLEETLELIEALGCRVSVTPGSTDVTTDRASVRLAGLGRWDVVEAIHEAGDLAYTVENVFAVLGVPGDAVFEELHNSNMTAVQGGRLLRSSEKRAHPRYYHPRIRELVQSCIDRVERTRRTTS